MFCFSSRGMSLRKRHQRSPGGPAASTPGEFGIRETARPGPHLAGVLCNNSLEVSSFARPGARDPRPGARPPGRRLRSARRREALRGAPAARADPQRGLHAPPPPSPVPAALARRPPGRARGGPHEVRTRLPAGPRPAARRGHLLEGAAGSRLVEGSERCHRVAQPPLARPPRRPGASPLRGGRRA